jgi:hypothetical protein
MKRILTSLLLSLALVAGLGSSCKNSRLEVGGAYAPVTGSTTNAAANLAFFQADSAYDLAYSAIDAAFKFEKENRAMLWKISPGIKHALDKIRPEAVNINRKYLAARAAYMAYPTPAGLGDLQTMLGQLQQLSAAAVAVLPKS